MIVFQYNLVADLNNYRYGFINRKFPDYGRGGFSPASSLPVDVLEKLKDLDENDQVAVIEQYLQNNINIQKTTLAVVRMLDEYWSLIEMDYVEKLCKYMGTSIRPTKIEAYVTTLSSCPYNAVKNYFYIPLFAGLPTQINCVMHELMHIIFLQNYRHFLEDKGVDKQGVLEINESMTELLNLEFKEFLAVPEYNNKPSIKDLSGEIIKMHNQKKSFKDMLDSLIKMRSNNLVATGETNDLKN